MILSIIYKPYFKLGKFKVGTYYTVTLLGALLILLTGRISFGDAIRGITENTSVNPLKILALFISMTLLSIYLGEAGFFSFVAQKLFERTKGGGIKLFIALYAVVAVLTVFTSNDIIILTFTPPILIFSKKAKISPVPYLIGEFVAANTWSMMLIVGNPTNIYLAGSFGISFFEYFKNMVLPAVLGGIFGFITLLLLFYRELTGSKQATAETTESTPVSLNKFLTVTALIHLLICIVLLAVSDFIHIEMWIICVALAVSLTVFNLTYGLIKEKSCKLAFSGLKKAPYELIPFVLSMFIIVLSLGASGITGIIGNAIISGGKTDGVIFGFFSAISANLLNNIPMSVLFEKIISGTSVYALYGAVIGSNIGAFITPVGALAGIMWNKILNEHGVKLPFIKFLFYGGLSALITLTASTVALYTVL